jgi:GH24 family phage-related lysozyme (muramidase)
LYAAGNPVTLADPNGLGIWDDILDAIFGLVDAVMVAVRASTPLLPTEMSSQGKEFFKLHEALELEAYDDDGVGNCTIGYGHLIHKGPCTEAEERTTISEQEADRLLNDDLAESASIVLSHLDVVLTAEEFDAVLSLYLGVGNQLFDSNTFELINEGSTRDEAQLIEEWNEWDLNGAAGTHDLHLVELDVFLNGNYPDSRAQIYDDPPSLDEIQIRASSKS